MTDKVRKAIVPAKEEFRLGLRDITPLSLGVAVYGLAFGLVAASEGMSTLATGLMGALVFAGSAQIVAVERLAADAGAILAVVAGLALNLRILLMTASSRGELSGRPLWQILLGVHLTSDENWVLMHATRNKGKAAGYWYLVGGGTSLILVWIFSTALGAAFFRSLPDLSKSGMEFAFTAAFILLLTSLWKGRGSLPSWTISAVIAAGCAWLLPLDPSWGLIAGAVVGAGFAGMQRHG